MIIVIGGGPAGFFGAIAAREARPDRPVVILEKHEQVLRKVAVSGGGRCNVTHACESARELATHYPRGGRELIGPFTRWGVSETIDWFADHGVRLKTEPDGRMFPVSDTSATIVDCLRQVAREAGVDVRTRQQVTGITSRDGGGFRIELADGNPIDCDQVLLATGGRALGKQAPSNTDGYALAGSLGHGLVQPVPSLFTFKVDDSLWTNLSGLSVTHVNLRASGPGFPGKGLVTEGPLLMTHWGFSGPAVLKLSALGARHFQELDYRFDLTVDWLPELTSAAVAGSLQDKADNDGKKAVATGGPAPLPKRLWRALVEKAEIPDHVKWAELGRKPRNRLLELLKNTPIAVDGKSTNKEEFVTCGGVPLAEVDLRTMTSRVCPGLFLAGETLDIDGVTGGFNFQAAWTTGRLAGLGMAAAETGRDASTEGDPS